MVAHNQHFDFPVVDGFRYLSGHGWKMSKPILNSNLFIVTFTKDSAVIVVLDSLNWFKFSLKTIGDCIGIPKLEIDFMSCSMKELEIYCRRDVEIIKVMMKKWLEFLKKYDFGNFRFTTASQAYGAFKHRFMKYDIFIHAHKPAVKLERDSHRGGRVEAFFIGTLKQRVYGFDVNSLYPDVMQRHDYPIKLVKYVKNGSLEGLERFLRNYCVCARVKVNISEPYIAYKANKLLFPVGSFISSLTTPELKYALEHDSIEKVYDYSVYEKAPIFREYVNTLYALKIRFSLEGNIVYYMLNKLLLNTLYGKFGQKIENIKVLGECEPDLTECEKIYLPERGITYLKWSFGGKIYVRHGDKLEWKHSFPAISSHVAAYGRMKLWSYMKLAGLENVFYVDTDSLFVNDNGYDKLKAFISDTELGKLKLDKTADNLTIFGAKDYIFGDLIKRKGIRKEAIPLGHGKFTQKRFYKFRSLLKQGCLDAPIVEDITKTLKRRYDKGIVHKDGTVTPLQLT